MTIVRAPRPEGNFYVLDKRISEDERLSWAARGLLVYLLGKPDHWRVSPAALVNVTVGTARPTGRDGVYGLLDELIRADYVRRKQERGPGGVLGPVIYIVSESPLPPQPDTAVPHPASPLPAGPTQASIEAQQEQREGQEGAPPLGSEPAAKGKKPEGITFDASTGRFCGPISDHFGRWRVAFPALDLDAEIARIESWLVANPANRKSNYLRFITNWLTRAQDRAPRVAAQGAQHGQSGSASERRAEFVDDMRRAAHGPH